MQRSGVPRLADPKSLPPYGPGTFPSTFSSPKAPDLQSQPWDLYPQHQTFLLDKTHPFLPLRNHRATLG